MKKLIIEYEYTRKLPPEAEALRSTDGEPILYAYECVLLECDTGDRFIYTAINLKNGGKEVLGRRSRPLTTSEAGKMAERIRQSNIAGAGWLQADRPVKNCIGRDKIYEILNAIFRRILPKYGYNLREEQISLSLHVLKTIERCGVTLAEAETGTGKTEGYLIPGLIAKRGRMNDAKNANLYPGMQYADVTKMPIVIATSSIALQRAIMTEYIPRLSRMLMDGGVIKKPLTAVLRKGKEHYFCERNLRSYLLSETVSTTRRALENLLLPGSEIDLAESDIHPHIKKKVCVTGRCSDACKYSESCQYLAFRRNAQSTDIDIQVCNHNYLLADTLRRAKGQAPLIPDYQTLVIDEAHKFIDAARTMYGMELSSEAASDIYKNFIRLTFNRKGLQPVVKNMAKKLCTESRELFKDLTQKDEDNDNGKKKGVAITADTARHFRNIRNITEYLLFLLRRETFYSKVLELLAWVENKYDISTAPINMKELLSETDVVNFDRKVEHEKMHSQMIRLHQAICALPEISFKMSIESGNQKKTRFHFNTERQLNNNERNNLRETLWRKSRNLLPAENATGGKSDWVVRLIWQIQDLCDKASTLCEQTRFSLMTDQSALTNQAHSKIICWIKQEDDADKLCAIPNNIGDKLYADQWSKGIPTILTSGTLSAAGDFSRTKQILGLDKLGVKLSETTHKSPFNYQENAMLYIPENIPFPHGKNKKYIAAITDEIEELVIASHGHAAVLFTSYDVMGRVYSELEKRKLPFPLFRLDKGGIKEIKRFKESGNGILFASGVMWEGIDIPGDALSMLIIVKLPFQMPNAISEYEQTLYPDFRSYLVSVLIPEMLIKLKQGFGRLIRTEDDSGCVAILDCRISSNGSYRKRVLNALPFCGITDFIADIKAFFQTKKPIEYFSN